MVHKAKHSIRSGRSRIMSHHRSHHNDCPSFEHRVIRASESFDTPRRHTWLLKRGAPPPRNPFRGSISKSVSINGFGASQRKKRILIQCILRENRPELAPGGRAHVLFRTKAHKEWNDLF
ncbi:hypothetical protein CEXT_645931 [Caerostris extrusa]|uniref:Uncharacterized protein n=1 Tax=Caerostris extrusa TaxID=172846 RepID=A0AAV4MEA9_CAEEX|nr:hypothetical protein CEXT_645931 [Caerostris extrusa]